MLKIIPQLELVLYDAKGKVIKKRKLKSDSFVMGFIDLLYVHMNNGADGLQLKDLSGNYRTPATHNQNFMVTSFTTPDTSKGIVAGTGTDPVSLTDYRLSQLILNGTSAGKLSYSSCTLTQPVTDRNRRFFTITRTLNYLL